MKFSVTYNGVVVLERVSWKTAYAFFLIYPTCKIEKIVPLTDTELLDLTQSARSAAQGDNNV